MPIDGVSFSNSGFNITNPTEVNVLLETAAAKEAEKKIKATDKSDKTKGDSEENEDREGDLQGRDTQGETDSEEDPKNLKDITEKNKKFKVKFNPATQMVEMQDANTGAVIETITPEDLIKVLSKSKAFSGVFVDRKI
ncbi:MAG: hypothetical protein A2Y25_09940 [Candidatus Melainabacteria bacterium GWF2_37_15]|nr:MAG: hypothetical protein A2Y25_09940 [Candidatus Melainabacteria bacterium GWF2_37_15]